MAAQTATPNTLFGALAPRNEQVRLAAMLGAMVLGSLLLALAAKVSVPVWPVPVTLQSLVVALLAGALGWRLGVASVALYMAEGLLGLPVFTAGGGPHYVLSPTFGFILGWLPMAYVIGRAAEGGLARRPLALFGAMVAGNAISFLLGFCWLLMLGSGAAWLDQGNLVGSAFSKAVQPFIVWDLLKMAFAAITIAGGWALFRPKA